MTITPPLPNTHFNKLDLVQVGFFKPIVDDLKVKGVNIDKLLRKSGLNKSLLDDVNHHVPTKKMYTFFDLLKKEQGIEDIVEVFGDLLQVASLSQYGEMIAFTPDLLTAIQISIKYNHEFLSNERLGLEINSSKAKYYSCLIDKPSAGREHAINILLALMINGFKIPCGLNWAPLEIHLQNKTAPNLDLLLPSGSNTKVFLNQPFTTIVFPTTILASPMLENDGQVGTDNDFSLKSSSLSSRIERDLESRQIKILPSFQQISEMAEMPSRSLQRKLAEEDTSYSSIIDKWRFKTAILQLTNPNIMIKDISTKLGYSNVPAFDRAFKRWTQTNPQQFRDSL